MRNTAIANTKVGTFVLAGLLFTVVMLYAIGKNRNLIGDTFTLKARVMNVNGLVTGNNVRFKGIDVGTVQKIEIADDTSIIVSMLIDRKMRPYIKSNAVVSIGTDGLMGNKLVNINSNPLPGKPVEKGAVLQSREPIETDEMLRTLNTTNNNIASITKNLQEVTIKLNNSNSLWNLLSDTIITGDLRSAVKDFRQAGHNSAALTSNATMLMQSLREGKGLASTLFTDTLLTSDLRMALHDLHSASRQTSDIVKVLDSVMMRLHNGDGTAGLLLSDSATKNRLAQSVINIENGTASFEENMNALRHNFLFRAYFRKLEKRKTRGTASKE